MQTRRQIDIPIVSSSTVDDEMTGSNCDDKRTVALMVLGDSMEPEFSEGEVLVIEMKAAAGEGAFVIAEVAEEDFIFRQLTRDEQDGWKLHALNPAYPDVALPGLESIKGVVMQKKKPGDRKAVKFYGAGV